MNKIEKDFQIICNEVDIFLKISKAQSLKLGKIKPSTMCFELIDFGSHYKLDIKENETNKKHLHEKLPKTDACNLISLLREKYGFPVFKVKFKIEREEYEEDLEKEYKDDSGYQMLDYARTMYIERGKIVAGHTYNFQEWIIDRLVKVQMEIIFIRYNEVFLVYNYEESGKFAVKKRELRSITVGEFKDFLELNRDNFHTYVFEEGKEGLSKI